MYKLGGRARLGIAEITTVGQHIFSMNPMAASCQPKHGYPARLVVPGFYGTDSVKWLTRIRLSESRAPGPFTTRRYNDPGLDSTGRETGETTPDWSVAPESLIVLPGRRERMRGWISVTGG